MRRAAWLLLLGAGCGAVERPPHEQLDTGAWALASGRPTEPSAELPRFAPGDAVESAVSPEGVFRVHFTRAGPNAVAPADADGNGIPDAVDTVARTYDAVARFYARLGYRTPPSDAQEPGGAGGDGRFDVYLVDFAGRADGAFRAEGCRSADQECHGYMLQENDFAGYAYPSYEKAVATLASHEFFHAVQAAYRTGLGRVAEEGTAVWASERFAPELDDLEHFSRAYLTSPDRSLVVDPDGPAQSFSYGAALFFQYLGERLGDGGVRGLWEESVRSPSARWPVLLDSVLRRDSGLDFDTAFAEFAAWNVATGARAGGGCSGCGGYARGAGYLGFAPEARALPVDEAALRVAAASARYVEVAGGEDTLSASFVPREGEASAPSHLLLAAVNEHAVLRLVRAEGTGTLLARVSARDASRVVVAVVNGRFEGGGQYGRLRIGEGALGEPSVEAPVEAPGEEPAHGCQAAPGLLPSALLLTGRAWLRAARRRKPESP